ncbi:hypothetical protein [Streptomyces yatensis]|uniref:Hemerythrin-like domain-containing protein n=1 Tax=Streptomyces yatensis TaxID=155177 RepID=A0ABP4U719_9ACTN|nr:hypothetical protein [Streptomyces yatensis]
MIAHLLSSLRAAVDRAAPPEELDHHLEGIAAIMENHFRYEERQLLTALPGRYRAWRRATGACPARRGH